MRWPKVNRVPSEFGDAGTSAGSMKHLDNHESEKGGSVARNPTHTPPTHSVCTDSSCVLRIRVQSSACQR